MDSILIDEARTPLIISGPAEESTDKYYRIDKIIPKLIQDIDYIVEEKHKTATLTEEGVSKTEKLLGLGNMYDPQHLETIHHVYQALRAHSLYKRDVEYVVKNGEVIIIDEFTGREMPGRRWSDGLHQAVEAKEGVKIERENQTLATITFQNYFRMYKKLSGMTGTAETEATEFNKIYKLDVSLIPTNRPLRREEFSDVVYRTAAEKYEAVVNGILQEDNTLRARHPADSRIGPAGPGRHDFHRKIGASGESAEKGGHPAPGTERKATRARSKSHLAGGTQRRGHGLDEHGRPRYRHPAGRQSRSHDARALPARKAGDSLHLGAGRDRRGRHGRQRIAQHGPVPAGRQNLSGARGAMETHLRSFMPSNAAPSTMK